MRQSVWFVYASHAGGHLWWTNSIADLLPPTQMILVNRHILT